MALDSSTLCARTTAGDKELATASLGLSLGQRRVLALLQDPIAVDELAQRHRLEQEKLARDLTRLAELRLVVLQGPAMMEETSPPVASPRVQVAGAMSRVVIGPGTRRFPALPLAAGATALALAVGIWYGTRSGESNPTSTNPTVAAPAAPPAATPPPQFAASATDSAPPVVVPGDTPVAAQPLPIVRAPRDGPLPSDVRVAARPVIAVAATPQKPIAVPIVAEPKTIAVTEPVVAPPPRSLPAALPVAPPAPAVVNAPPPAVVNAPPPAATPPAERGPPVQLAAAAPSRPPAPAGLKAISREPPDFPKEAIADGLRSGQVYARIHVDARGAVTAVDILSSQPPRVFDRAARRALLRWQFEPNAAGIASEAEVEVKFQRD